MRVLWLHTWFTARMAVIQEVVPPAPCVWVGLHQNVFILVGWPTDLWAEISLCNPADGGNENRYLRCVKYLVGDLLGCWTWGRQMTSWEIKSMELIMLNSVCFHNLCQAVSMYLDTRWSKILTNTFCLFCPVDWRQCKIILSSHFI